MRANLPVMSSRWQPGQLLFSRFEGTEVPADLARLISEGRVGGVILFGRNLASAEQVRELTLALHSHAPEDWPLLIAIDQEGGQVQRLRAPWTEWPPMRRLGDVDDLELTSAVARALARELLDIGIALDFAPCVDVDSNPQNPVIGERSFGSDAWRVAKHARCFVAAMQESGVAACAKHFPGHGDTSSDSHFELPRIDHDLERLRAVELPPFEAAVEAGVASIMTAHVLFPALDRMRPATLSPDVLVILREELGYDGVVFSDDIEMKAIADHAAPKAIVEGCLEAGVDSVIVCEDASLREEVLHILEHVPDSRLERPLTRMGDLKGRWTTPQMIASAQSETSGPPYPDHQALAARLGGIT